MGEVSFLMVGVTVYLAAGVLALIVGFAAGRIRFFDCGDVLIKLLIWPVMAASCWLATDEDDLP